MADYYDVSILVHMILDEEFRKSEEMIMRMHTIPTCLLAKDFHERLQGVLFLRRRITSCRWRNFFDTCFEQMLSSHEMYVAFVMFACFREDECHQNIFESFLSVCCLVKILCDETFKKTGVNFRDFSLDILMVFYEYQLEKVFKRRGGFRCLVEYIRDHKYLKWIRNWGNIVLPDDLIMDYFISPDHPIQRDLDQKLEKELRREGVIEQEIYPIKVATDASCIDLAKEILSTIFVLPSLPNHLDLMKKVAKYSKGKRRTDAAEKLELMNVDLNGYSGSTSEYKTDCIAKHQDNFEQHDNIIQAVIKHNSKRSSNKNIKSGLQEEEVLVHLKDMIKSLTDVLNEFDKE